MYIIHIAGQQMLKHIIGGCDKQRFKFV